MIAKRTRKMLSVLGQRRNKTKVLKAKPRTNGAPDQCVFTLRIGCLPDTGGDDRDLLRGVCVGQFQLL